MGITSSVPNPNLIRSNPISDDLMLSNTHPIANAKLIGKLELGLELQSAAVGLPFVPVLQIDLEALMLLDEANLLEMKIEIGPRKKILKAIEERRKALEDGDNDEAAIEDSRL